MKIPAPIMPPITAIVVPKRPSWRASPLPWGSCLFGFSLFVIETDWSFPHERPSRFVPVGAYSITPATAHKIGPAGDLLPKVHNCIWGPRHLTAYENCNRLGDSRVCDCLHCLGVAVCTVSATRYAISRSIITTESWSPLGRDGRVVYARTIP